LILLDTHAVIWLAEGSPKLGPKSRALADDALAGTTLTVSAISFWEVAMLRRKGRIVLHQSAAAWRAGLLEMGLTEIGIDGEIAVAAAKLADIHEDPADRIIVATASRAGATLITADRRIQEWSGELRTQDARA
jgi:PIN domain nuclease of toxin-antitoxin system